MICHVSSVNDPWRPLLFIGQLVQQGASGWWLNTAVRDALNTTLNTTLNTLNTAKNRVNKQHVRRIS